MCLNGTFIFVALTWEEGNIIVAKQLANTEADNRPAAQVANWQTDVNHSNIQHWPPRATRISAIFKSTLLILPQFHFANVGPLEPTELQLSFKSTLHTLTQFHFVQWANIGPSEPLEFQPSLNTPC